MIARCALAFSCVSLFAGVLATAYGCSSPTPRIEHVYDGYDASAYPNARPKIALPLTDFALVPSSATDTVTLIDLAAEKALGSAPVGRSPVVIDGPHQVVGHPASRRAYVLHAYPGTFEGAGNHGHGSSTRFGWVQALSLDDLSAVAEVIVDPNPGEIAIAEDGRRLVVTHYDLSSASAPDKTIDQRRSTLALIDPAGMRPYGTPQPDKLLVCIAPHGLTLSRPDARKAFVACYGEDAVAIVDLEDTHAPVVRVPVGPGARQDGARVYGPYGVALSPDGSRLAIGSRYSKDVRFLDVAASAMTPLVVSMIGEVYVPAWSLDGARLYVPTRNLDALVAIDTATGAVLAQHPFDPASCVAPIEAALGGDGTTLHVVCEGTQTTPGSVVTLDATTLEMRGQVDVGFFPGRPYLGRGL